MKRSYIIAVENLIKRLRIVGRERMTTSPGKLIEFEAADTLEALLADCLILAKKDPE